MGRHSGDRGELGDARIDRRVGRISLEKIGERKDGPPRRLYQLLTQNESASIWRSAQDRIP